jgi:hypothetical protein
VEQPLLWHARRVCVHSNCRSKYRENGVSQSLKLLWLKFARRNLWIDARLVQNLNTLFLLIITHEFIYERCESECPPLGAKFSASDSRRHDSSSRIRKFKVKYFASSRVKSIYIARHHSEPAAFDRNHRCSNSWPFTAEKGTTRKLICTFRSKLLFAPQSGPRMESVRRIGVSLGPYHLAICQFRILAHRSACLEFPWGPLLRRLR